MAQVPPMLIFVPICLTGEKPEKFSGLNFKRWQQKMLFYLTTLNLARFLTEDAPKLKEDEHDIQVISAIDAWKHSDFLCRNYVMNGLADSLYNVYSDKKTAKELWESLDRKYKTEDAGAKKFVVGRFLDYKMVDSKTVVSQVQELQVILHEIHAEGMMLSETFQVAAIIEKLPPAWKDFKNDLKHKRKEMSIEDLIIRLRIEEDNRRSEKKGAHTLNEAKANFVEHGQSSKAKTNNNKGKGSKLGPKGGISKKPKFQGKCFNCGKQGHKSVDCRLPKKNKPKEANVIDDITKNVSDIDLTDSLEVNLVGSNRKEWWMDTKMFSTFEPIENGEKVFMGNSATSEIKGQGKVILKMTSGKELTLTNVLYVPEIRKNLVSGSLLNNHGFRLVFESNKFILSKSGMYVGKGYMSDGMWKLNVMTIIKSNMNKASTSTYMLESSNLWHGRLGHVNYDILCRLINLNHIPTFQINSKHKCETCVEAKLTRSSFQMISRDLKFVQTRGGNKYFITFVDDSTKYCYVYLLKSKDEAIEKFVLYKNEVENQLNKKIKVLRSDRGGEYESPFVDICAQHGIIHETTAPYSPQSNGVAERKNRTLKEMMNAMLISSSLPQNMWGEAILIANYLLNKVPKKKAEKTSYELWKGRKPSYTYLRMWGCLAKVAVPPPKKVKIGPKTIDCIFIGYAHNSNAYRFLVYESNIPDIHKNTIMESRNASFFKDVFPCKPKKSQVEPRRSKMVRIEKSFGLDFLTFMFEGEPQTFKEAVNSTEGLMWKEAIKMDLPPGCKPLSSKWIFKRKMKVDGSIDKYKARLVIKGCTNEGLDYFDTYSPVTRINSIRMVLGIAALRNLEIHQMDMKKSIWSNTRVFHSGQEKKVCKPVKSLYGLKQAIKQWHEKFDNVMLSHGFKINECDKYDMLIVGSDDKMITSTKNMLNSRFDMKDMGLADIIRVARTPVDVTLHLSKNKGESVSKVEYSRTDIAYAVSKLSRYTSNPGAKHWQGIIRVLKYLRFTRDYGLHYTRYPAVLEGYSDANWISNVKDSKSHSGYVFTLGGAAVSWKSSKQTVIARSTMESEFIALDKCGEEAEWLRHFLEDIPRWSNPVPPICIHCDSQSQLVEHDTSNMYNGKSRHIRRRHNTIKQLLSTRVISMDYVKSKDNIADPLTKGYVIIYINGEQVQGHRVSCLASRVNIFLQGKSLKKPNSFWLYELVVFFPPQKNFGVLSSVEKFLPSMSVIELNNFRFTEWLQSVVVAIQDRFITGDRRLAILKALWRR
ncbi:hypothetical protein AAG906_017660 [Vitis piasezkii]